MIIKEYYGINNGVRLYRTFSTDGFYIAQNETGIEYIEAVDVESAYFTYTETNKKIENLSDITAEEALNIILGGETE